MEEKIRRIVKWMEGEKAPPFEIQINPTNKCNLNCIFCRPKGYANIKETGLPTEKWVSTIKEASRWGVRHWNILGGEPFIESKKVIHVMETIKKEGMSGITSTNGTLLSEDIIKKLINMGWDDLILSIDGACPTTHDILRGKQGTFKKCTDTIRLINHQKRLMNKDKPRLQLFFVITKKNYKEIPEFIKLAKSLKIKKVVFQAMIQTHPPSKELKLNEQDQKNFEIYAKHAEKIAKEESIITNISDFFDCMLITKANQTKNVIKQAKPDKTYPICYEPLYMMQISAEGYANPCCNLESKKASVKQNSLKEIWYGSFFENFRKKIYSRKLSKRCSRCCSGQILRNNMVTEELEKRGISFLSCHNKGFLQSISKLILNIR